MPIHLGSIGRRRFLSTALGAGLGLAAQGVAPGSVVRGSGSRSWVLLSDPHVAADLLKISRGACMAENLRRVIGEIRESGAGEDGVIVNGDCAHLYGKGGDYRAFTSLMNPLADEGRALHLLMGNHDDRKVFAKHCEEHCADQQPVEGRHVGMIEAPEANWFLLDSLDKGSWRKGEIGEEQLAWLSTMLDAHREKPAIVMAHHHPKAGPWEGKRSFTGLKDSERVMEVLRSRRQVKAYFFGHTHRWNITRDESGLYLVNLPPVAYLFNRSNPNGWVNADLRGDGMRLEMRALERKHSEHGVSYFLKWRAT